MFPLFHHYSLRSDLIEGKMLENLQETIVFTCFYNQIKGVPAIFLLNQSRNTDTPRYCSENIGFPANVPPIQGHLSLGYNGATFFRVVSTNTSQTYRCPWRSSSSIWLQIRKSRSAHRPCLIGLVSFLFFFFPV